MKLYDNMARKAMLAFPPQLVQLKKRLMPQRVMPLADAIRIQSNGDALVGYKGKEYIFKRYQNADYEFIGLLEEAFVIEPYKSMNVKGMNVIDLGCSIGDTPISFVANGARKVIGYETDTERFSFALENVSLNGLAGRIELHNRAFNPKELESLEGTWLMKIDIDGGEYDLFKKFTDALLQKVSGLMLEYERKDESLFVDRLRKAGFEIAFPRLNQAGGMLYAYK